MINLDGIVNRLNADSAAIMMPNKAERYLFCYDSFNMPPEWIDIKNSFDEKMNTPGGNVAVYFSGEPATTNNLRIKLKKFYIESVLIVPIKRKGKVIATLEVIHDKNNKTFTDEDRKRAEAFAQEIEPKLAI